MLKYFRDSLVTFGFPLKTLLLPIQSCISNSHIRQYIPRFQTFRTLFRTEIRNWSNQIFIKLIAFYAFFLLYIITIVLDQKWNWLKKQSMTSEQSSQWNVCQKISWWKSKTRSRRGPQRWPVTLNVWALEPALWMSPRSGDVMPQGTGVTAGREGGQGHWEMRTVSMSKFPSLIMASLHLWVHQVDSA